MTTVRRFAVLLQTTIAIAVFLTGGAAALPADSPPLRLNAKIPLSDVHGRIDHMAVPGAEYQM
jgi:hypothetical protein